MSPHPFPREPGGVLKPFGPLVPWTAPLAVSVPAQRVAPGHPGPEAEEQEGFAGLLVFLGLVYGWGAACE